MLYQKYSIKGDDTIKEILTNNFKHEMIIYAIAEPDTGQYLVTREREHHFIGTAIKVKSWMNRRYSEEDRAFVRLDYGAARDIAKLLREIPEQDKARAIMLFQFYKYSAYDLDKPFLIQFEGNQNQLLNSLRQLINKSKSI